MNVRIQTLIAEIEALPVEDQDDFASLAEVFLAQRSEGAVFTPEELAHLDRIAAEPDELADPAEVEAFLAGHDGAAVFTPEELEHIARIEAEPFVEADPKEIAALFGRRA